ncbi:MAG: DUF4282 domain-containing protein [Hyphomonadaceae bacterium]|nr:DUF4282 domain-containing protein [Hyphomonadaceae bacterium]
MGNWLEKFLSFDRMMGEDLVRKTYYVGLVLIAGWVVLSLLLALVSVFSNFGRALSLIVTTPLLALFALMIWRVIAERLMLDWQNGDTNSEDAQADEAPIPGEVVGAADAEGDIVDAEFDVAAEAGTTEDDAVKAEVVEIEEDEAEEVSEVESEENDALEEDAETRP